MNILIYGDSQSGHTGAVLQKLLKPGNKVTRVTKSGKSSSYLADYARNNLSRTWDRVYLFNGGNDGSVQSSSVRSLLDHFTPSTKIVYLGLPPATTITNIPLAKKVWGSATPGKFFPTTANKREKKNSTYTKIASAYTNVDVLDFRLAPVSNAVTQPSGVMYPNQPDGIHTSGKTALEVARWIAGFTRTLDQPDGNLILAASAAVVAFLYWRSK